MYSIYHGGTLSDEKVIINSNDRALQKIKAWQRQAEEEKLRQKMSEAQEFIDKLDKDENGLPVLAKNDDGTYVIPDGDDGKPLFDADENGHPVFHKEEEEETIEEDTSVETEEERQRILDSAEVEAQSIMDKAKEEADALFLHTRDEAVQQGYTDGLNKAREENEAKQQSLDQRAQTLEDNYRQKEESMEKEVLEAVLSVVSKAFMIEYSDDEELLLKLVDDCINHAESAKELLIRANDRNYAQLTSKRDEITEKVGEGVSIEFAKDPLLTDSQCMIETDGGVYDVSIDTELNNLIKRIRLLALQ